MVTSTLWAASGGWLVIGLIVTAIITGCVFRLIFFSILGPTAPLRKKSKMFFLSPSMYVCATGLSITPFSHAAKVVSPHLSSSRHRADFRSRSPSSHARWEREKPAIIYINFIIIGAIAIGSLYMPSEWFNVKARSKCTSHSTHIASLLAQFVQVCLWHSLFYLCLKILA